ncbi:hypothetical protein K493DRAFT_321349 [Basidiobolus meristosporus CBS 931.73]|uniref:DUF3020 domain-containing protein n=1 Tax=Basidiobolus meristosporus CBS 931.73 TaxID=1314790 RepID=A0A1Y1WVX3_9FUNG|nr:hypothetical protein K493DRAFT_321349 [Basidiobolus meristosporus CBS 931.73]|eukprot:ORX77612.1 hypothetical protein K493DRAFT_321349 [Basidiobolus meristosporus CBS 931.73]
MTPTQVEVEANSPSVSANECASNGGKPSKVMDEALLEKMRAENRERKKKWRQQNEERNKDNDLRCRVNKRANKLFGPGPSDHKTRWTEEEFKKRQQKRKEKERRKLMVSGTSTMDGGHIMMNGQVPLTSAPLSGMIHMSGPSSSGFVSPSQYSNMGVPIPMPYTGVSSHPMSLLNMNANVANSNGPSLPSVSSSAVNGMSLMGPILPLPNNTATFKYAISTNPHPAISAPSSTKMVSPAPVKSESSSCAPDYPMDAVMTLMQLNSGWQGCNRDVRTN